jgi:diacylglycerol kinase (ATP)
MNEPDDYSFDQNPHKGNKGLKRAIKASINSWNGLQFAIKEESAFRQELTLTAILLPISFMLPISSIEHILLVMVVVLVLIVELLNSSVEAAIDRISFDNHGLSKRAKDYGSAAVMLALIFCIFTWIYILVPHLKTIDIPFFNNPTSFCHICATIS